MEHRNASILSRSVEGGAKAISDILLLMILVFVFSNVVTRAAFAHSFSFFEEFSKYAQIWIAYLMLGVVEKTREHIAVDILYRMLPVKYQIVLLVVHDLMGVIFCVALFWSGAAMAWNWYLLGLKSITEVGLPMWTVMASACFGACILSFFLIERIIADVRSVFLR